MLEEIKKDAETRMGKSVDSLKQDMAKVRTGRAHISLLDTISVMSYGSKVPLNQVANVSVADARTLSVTPWEKDMVQPIEKAIMSSDLGLNPNTSGTIIRIPLPPLTEDRRKDLIKVVRAEAEGGRVAVRNIRRDALGDVKSLLKEKDISEDEDRKTHDQIQKITDKFVAQIENVLKAKEKELMEI